MLVMLNGVEEQDQETNMDLALAMQEVHYLEVVAEEQEHTILAV